MKKIILCVVTLFLIVGCNSGPKKMEKEKAKRYESYWNAILDHDKFATKSSTFDIEAKMVKGQEGYEYNVTVSNPKNAMYNVEILSVINNMPFDNAEVMMPSAGIADGPYTLIPNQERADKNFRKGLGVNGISTNPEANLKVIVSWKDASLRVEQQEFIEFNLKAE